jgi:hypothetical protein
MVRKISKWAAEKMTEIEGKSSKKETEAASKGEGNPALEGQEEVALQA